MALARVSSLLHRRLPTWRRLVVVLMLICFMVLPLTFLATESIFHTSQYDVWRPLSALRPSRDNSDLRYFKVVEGQATFLYSAIANTREPQPGEINVIITAFDSTGTDSFQCCVLVDGQKNLFRTTATVFFKHYVDDVPVLGPILQWFKYVPTPMKQYSCVVPATGSNVSHVMLTSSVCPASMDDYLPVVYPRVVPNGLAICAKTAFGDQLEATKLMEWLEVQRLLGVDHVQIMDLNNTPAVRKVFQYYSDLGFLTVLPYELPGEPRGRGLDGPHRVFDQFFHDESFSILECRQRLAGYTYVLGIDMDEILMPVQHQDIKTLLKEQMTLHPDAAGFFFWTQFFLSNWGPQNNDSDISLFRYLYSMTPIWNCKKYVYLPARVFQARTHDYTARSPYQKHILPVEVATLHHYRLCPSHWKTCGDPPSLTDRKMLRFAGTLNQRLERARQVTGVRPRTTKTAATPFR